VLTRAMIQFGTGMPKSERRFVPFTIRRATPWVFVYLAAIALRNSLPSWLGLEGDAEQGLLLGAQLGAIALLRDVAAFTLCGYTCAELQARSTDKPWKIVLRVFALGLAVGAVFVGAQYRGALDGFEAQQIVLVAGAGLAGAVIHRAQLRLVRSWNSQQARKMPSTPSRP
jgi:hypothetical protein